MKIAFLADPLHTFKTYKDSTYAMMVEAVKRGHHLYVFEQKDLVLEGGIVMAQISRVVLTGEEQRWYHKQTAKMQFLSEFDAILIRKDPPFDMEYIYTTYLLELAEFQGARVFNKPRAIRDHNEKLAIAQFSQFAPPTLVSRDALRLRAFHQEHHDVILKPLDGMGGSGIFRVKQDGFNLGSIIETLTNYGQRTIMIQRFIPEISAGDKRVLLIGGKVVPYSLARIPQGNEVRGNLAVGGVGVSQPLTVRESEIATTLGPLLQERGLLLVGLDIIGNYLTEVNVTSPTCFQEIKQQAGFDVAAMFMDAVEAVLC